MTEITLRRVIVHKLVKEQHKPIQKNIIRSDVLSADNSAVRSLVEGVLKVYGSGKNRAHYGTFSTDEDNRNFPNNFNKYHSCDQPTDQEFINLSKQAMIQLRAKAGDQPFASGGYILFVDYDSQGIRFFLIAMIKEASGIAISEDLDPESLVRLDLDKLHQAARINFDKYKQFIDSNDEEEKSKINFLSFISGGSNLAASGYFVTALGCSKGTTSDRATKTLIEESIDFFRKNSKISSGKEKFRKSLLEYLKEKESSGTSAKLNEVGQLVLSYIPLDMSEEADDLVESLLTHLNSDLCSVPAEFPVSKREIKKKTHIKIDTNDWKFEFDRKLLGSSDSAPIYYNSESGALTLKNIPLGFRTIIEQELIDKG